MVSEIPKTLLVPILQLPRILIPHSVLLRVDIKALGVARVADGGDDGPAVALLVDGVPVDARKKGVGFHLGGAALDVAEAAGAVDGAELADDVLCGVADGGVLGEDDWFFDNSVREGLEGYPDGDGRLGKGGGAYCL